MVPLFCLLTCFLFCCHFGVVFLKQVCSPKSQVLPTYWEFLDSINLSIQFNITTHLSPCNTTYSIPVRYLSDF